MSPTTAKAPWYFLGFQELLFHLHPVFAVCVWPLLGLAVLVWLPFWRGSALPPGVWFGSVRGRKLALRTAITRRPGGFVHSSWETIFCCGRRRARAAIRSSRAGSSPTVLLIALLVVLYLLLVMKLKYTRAEAVMAGVILLLVALIVCAIVAYWFRGPEMRLVLPWNLAAHRIKFG